jgi:dienelactone hydrolase
MRRFPATAYVICALAIGPGAGVSAAEPRPVLRWETAWIPLGERQGVRLEAHVARPDGDGPFPVAIVSHGSTGRGRIPAKRTLRSEFVANEFVKRGFLVVAPMRSGRGASGGEYEEPYECDFSAAQRGLENAIRDTEAVIAYLEKIPQADRQRVVLSGQSRGGILSVAFAARHPSAVRGVINFAGGWTHSACADRDGGFNEVTFGKAGAAAGPAIPMLFAYAGNDSYFPPTSVRKFSAAFEGAGGNLSLRLYGSIEGDGHMLFTSPHVWARDFHAFLDGLGFAAK